MCQYLKHLKSAGEIVPNCELQDEIIFYIMIVIGIILDMASYWLIS